MRKFYLFLLITSYFFSISVSAQDKNTLARKDTSEIRFLNQRKFYVYKPEKGETLFSISKKFNIPQEEIKEFNADLQKDWLKPKMKIWIPAHSLLKKSTETVQVTAKEAPYTDRVFSISLLLALNIPKNYSLDPALVDSNFIVETLDKESVSNLEFYEGVLMAIDSLRSMKLKVHLYVYDTENDSSKTVELFKNQELKKTDVIISNGNMAIIKLINDFSKMNHVRFASCSMNGGDLLNSNPDAIGMLPSSLTQCKEMGKYSAVKFIHDNCIILKTPVGKENDRSFAFRRGWLDASDDKLKEVSYSSDKDPEKEISAIKDSLSKKINNLIFVPSSNEDFVSGFVNGLKPYSEEYKITLIGLPTWQYFETIDPILFELHNVNIFSSSFINPSADQSIQFRKKYFSIYNNEPMETAFEGHDVMMLLGSELLQKGDKFIDHLPSRQFNGLYSSYKFEKASANSFTENHYISVCRFRNYELKKVN